MTLLDRIVADKYDEINFKKSVVPISQLEKSVFFERNTSSLSKSLNNGAIGIIAQHRRRFLNSFVHSDLNCFDVIKAYEDAGMSSVSISTDVKYFSGALDDLLVARASCSLPILRDDFIIDEFQIYETKSYGSDAILLKANILTKDKIKYFTAIAKSIRLEVLLEVQTLADLESIVPEIDIIVVNNFNIENFSSDVSISRILSERIPEKFIKVSVGGLSDIETIVALKSIGFQAVIVDCDLMNTDAIFFQAKKFIQKINKRVEGNKGI